MSDWLDFNQKLVLCDAAGNVVGIVLAPKAVQDLTAERDQLRAEVNCLRVEASELRQALDATQQDLRDKAAITAERDQHLESLSALLRKDMCIEPDVIVDREKKGVESSEAHRGD